MRLPDVNSLDGSVCLHVRYYYKENKFVTIRILYKVSTKLSVDTELLARRIVGCWLRFPIIIYNAI